VSSPEQLDQGGSNRGFRYGRRLIADLDLPIATSSSGDNVVAPSYWTLWRSFYLRGVPVNVYGHGFSSVVLFPKVQRD
jgi:hypothetical protein